MTITAKDIAERLQVSPSAVSLAMNGKPGVSEATRERIMTEAVRMGYSIHKKEISTTARNIRFVIFLSGKPNMEEDTLAPEILQGIESRAQEYGHNVLVSYFYADGDWAAQTLNICRDTAGMIVLASGMEEQHVEKARALLERQEIPVILIGNTMELSDVDCICADNLQGASLAVRHLLEMGHPDVGYLRARPRNDSFEERQAGMLHARRKFGLNDRTLMQYIDVGTTSEQAFRDVGAWLAQGGQPLSAYFADTDVIAAAAVRAFSAHGYRIPEDISVIGFGDLPICTMIDPELTTVRVMREQMGSAAMDRMCCRLHDSHRSPGFSEGSSCRMIISANLVRRDSVARHESGQGAYRVNTVLKR
jgi:DNA-binding LacI/PurR family transcriptional regulator